MSVLSASRFFAERALAEFRPLAEFVERLGRTRLLELPARPGEATILAKCELENPTGTIKDRTACAMMWRLLSERGSTGVRVLEYSGGTLARPLAALCRDLGIESTLVLSSAADESILADLRAAGARIVLVPKEQGFYAVMQRAVAMHREDPGFSFLYQHENAANLDMHELGTGAELVEALGGRTAHAWIASIGTGGTLVGVHRALARHSPGVQVYATTPSELPYGSDAPPNGLPKFAGSGGLGCGIRQPFVVPLDATIRRHFTYSLPETFAIMCSFHRETGIRIGSSSAANLAAAREIARELGEGAIVVTVFPSAGTREEWAKAELVAVDAPRQG